MGKPTRAQHEVYETLDAALGFTQVPTAEPEKAARTALAALEKTVDAFDGLTPAQRSGVAAALVTALYEARSAISAGV